MSSHSTDESMASPQCAEAQEETPPAESSRSLGEGLGVFRALLLTAIFYLAAGWLLWLAWHAFRHWRAH